jgi:hypothetical protein
MPDAGTFDATGKKLGGCRPAKVCRYCFESVVLWITAVFCTGSFDNPFDLFLEAARMPFFGLDRDARGKACPYIYKDMGARSPFEPFLNAAEMRQSFVSEEFVFSIAPSTSPGYRLVGTVQRRSDSAKSLVRYTGSQDLGKTIEDSVLKGFSAVIRTPFPTRPGRFTMKLIAIDI